MAARELLTVQIQFYLNYTHAEIEHLEDDDSPDTVQQPPVVFLLFLVLVVGHCGWRAGTYRAKPVLYHSAHPSPALLISIVAIFVSFMITKPSKLKFSWDWRRGC